MHLKQLKIAGFKSFVDPCIVYFPSQLVGVVGPNGCGKSNIIDAVRWVMGESSAKNLRGESMTDVIFNGSSGRKSLGQASVELIFDNSLGRFAGPFSSYGEIAVKRIVTRSGDSSYYLNGSRCRRKDITDIFLGTGAGARGYSIIGQGTISQLIEAKPEELRVFFEEAAGVSKYKERRRETLQRISSTKENITRVADIKEELEKQLLRLGRQAKAAERYLILKKEEQQCRAEILAFKWKDFIDQQHSKQVILRDYAVRYEDQQSFLAKLKSERILLNETLFEISEKNEQIQGHFFQLSTGIAELEAKAQQHINEKKRVTQELFQMQADLKIAIEQSQHDQQELMHARQQEQTFAMQLEQLSLQCKNVETDWQDAQKNKSLWDLKWQEFQIEINNLQREMQLAKVNAEHLDEKQQNCSVRLEKNQEQHGSISLNELHQTQKKLEARHIELMSEQENNSLPLEEGKKKIKIFHEKLQDIERQIHKLQEEFFRTNSEYTELMATQRAVSKCSQKENIFSDGDKRFRLVDILKVEAKWQFACERVLSETLHAYVLENLDELWHNKSLSECRSEDFITLQKKMLDSSIRPRLIDKIHENIPSNVFPLEHIYLAEDVEDALQTLPKLAEHQSVITPNGFWFGPGWVKFVIRKEQDEMGILARQEKIADLSLRVQDLHSQINLLRVEREQTQLQLEETIKEHEVVQIHMNGINEILRLNEKELSTNAQAIIHAEKQLMFLSSEKEELRLLLEEIVTNQWKAKESVHLLESKYRDYEEQQKHYYTEKRKWQELLALKNNCLEDARSSLHLIEREHDKEKNKIQQLEARIQREQERLCTLQERLDKLAEIAMNAERPALEIKEQLAQKLIERTEVELKLTLNKEHALNYKIDLEACEKKISNYDLEIKHLDELIAQTRIEEQALVVRAASIQESLDELGLQASLLLEHIPPEMTQNKCEEQLSSLCEQIKHLGGINLAAIEEYTTEQQRKIYLDEQYNDLSQALLTLEIAIEKMDKETQLRLENTFDEVNALFKTLFPRLFGGGRAQLELTCNNMLEAGIVVMAQPPGKRNSSIHLLSGGEKAMTAVALVFAIFQLNPSPFCMLDEVDAPLDDVNVGRFCSLVKEMSQFVQFLLITHNKVTMELAEHLIGVTMREPGVSRLVAVDVNKSLETCII